MTYEFHLKPGGGMAPKPLGVKAEEPAWGPAAGAHIRPLGSQGACDVRCASGSCATADLTGCPSWANNKHTANIKKTRGEPALTPPERPDQAGRIPPVRAARGFTCHSLRHRRRHHQLVWTLRDFCL